MEEKFTLMQMALEIFRLELERGNVTSSYFSIYNKLKYELQSDIDTKPSAEEYFKNNRNQPIISTESSEALIKEESYNHRIR